MSEFKISEERAKNVLIFAFGTLEGLIDKGFVSGPKNLTEEGIAEYKKLVDSGFEPTEEELEWAMAVIMRNNDLDTLN